MANLFDFLGCSSILGGSEKEQRRSHPPRRPARSAGPITPHVAPHTVYPMTRVPTARDMIYRGQRVPEYPMSQDPASAEGYWVPTGRPVPPIQHHLASLQQRIPEMYPPQYVENSEVWCGQMEEEEETGWAQQVYPSQFPAARQRLQQMPPLSNNYRMYAGSRPAGRLWIPAPGLPPPPPTAEGHQALKWHPHVGLAMQGQSEPYDPPYVQRSEIRPVSEAVMDMSRCSSQPKVSHRSVLSPAVGVNYSSKNLQPLVSDPMIPEACGYRLENQIPQSPLRPETPFDSRSESRLQCDPQPCDPQQCGPHHYASHQFQARQCDHLQDDTRSHQLGTRQSDPCHNASLQCNQHQLEQRPSDSQQGDSRRCESPQYETCRRHSRDEVHQSFAPHDTHVAPDDSYVPSNPLANLPTITPATELPFPKSPSYKPPQPSELDRLQQMTTATDLMEESTEPKQSEAESGQSSLAQYARYHQPDTVASNESAPASFVPEVCVCDECKAARPLLCPEPPSEKAAQSPLPHKGLKAPSDPTFPSVPTKKGSPKEEESVQMGEAGVEADMSSSGVARSWGTCGTSVQSSEGPGASDFQAHGYDQFKSCAVRSAQNPKVTQALSASTFAYQAEYQACVDQIKGQGLSKALSTPHREHQDFPEADQKATRQQRPSKSPSHERLGSSSVTPCSEGSPSSPKKIEDIRKAADGQLLEASPKVVARHSVLGKCSSACIEHTTSESSCFEVERPALRRYLSSVPGVRDDLDKALQSSLLTQNAGFQFVKLKRGFYAVIKSAKTYEAETHRAALRDGRMDIERSMEHMYYGKAQQAAARLPPCVFCYVQVTIEYGNLYVAVLPRTRVLQHLGAVAVRKWLTPENRFFIQQRQQLVLSHRRSSSAMSARLKKDPLPVGGNAPWRNGQAHPLPSFIEFCKRECGSRGTERNSDPCPARIPSDRFGFDEPKTAYPTTHHRRASN